LGSSSNRQDYDYNDLVFDARIVDEYKVIKNADGTEDPYTGDTSHRYYAKLTPLAAGGEYVMWFDQNNQPIHSLFVPSTANNVLINTCKSGQNTSLSHIEGLPAQTIIYTFNSEEEANINNITIFVRSATATYDITAIPAEAPHKLCVPPGTRWPYERMDISKAYTGFTDYVEERIDPWDDGVDANLYPLDDVPDSLKTDQYNQYTEIKDTQNSTSSTSYNVTPSNSETTIWTGSNDFGNWEGENAIVISNSQFSNVGAGTVIRFYGVADGYFQVKATYGNTWDPTNLGDSRWSGEGCIYSNTSLSGYFELTLNATTAANFKSYGMRLWGKGFKLLSVTYDTASGSGTQIWSGSSALGYDLSITIGKENFANAKSTSRIRFTATASGGWAQIFIKKKKNQWEVEDIVQTWASSQNSWPGTCEFTIGDYLNVIQNNDICIQGGGLTLTKVELIP
jgi:hypothetical protein